MRPNRLRQIWAEGGAAVNGWMQIPHGFASEIMAGQGWDSLTVDMQHGPVGYDSALTMLQAIFVFTFAIIVGAVSMLPGGLGSAEATMVGLLVALGVEVETALAATVVIRATTLWFGVALGFLALPAALRMARSHRGPGAMVTP